MNEIRAFTDNLIEEIYKKESILCVGLDPQLRFFPKHVLEYGFEEAADKSGFEPAARAIVYFNREIIEEITPFTAIIKPNRAFYEQYGYWGIWALEETIKLCRKQGLLVLEDAKRSDGGDSSKAYSAGHLGKVDVWNKKEKKLVKIKSLDVDAITVMPHIGSSCLNPFLEEARLSGKGIFLVIKTSFKPNSEVEQIQVTSWQVWGEIAFLAKDNWIKEDCTGKYGMNNVGAVVGANHPLEAVTVREILPNSFFLVPGYGAQGGGADGAVKGIREENIGLIVNSSRSINYAYNKKEFEDYGPKKFAEASGKAAQIARNDLNGALKKAGIYY